MFNSRSLVLASVIGTVLQIVMVLWGHSNPSIARLFAVGGMGISLLAGLLYVFLGRGNSPSPTLGGAIAGGVCALIGIFVSYMRGDVPAGLLAYGTLSSVVTGALGGWFGRLLTRGQGSALAGLFLVATLSSHALRAQSVPSSPGVAATTKDFAWLAGRWQGRLRNSTAVTETVFAPPAAGVIAGVMRLIDRDTVRVVELISLVDAPDGVEMRFRHFSSALDAYETTFRQTMRLTTHDATHDVFENLVPFDEALMSTQPRVTVFQRTGAQSFVGKSDIIDRNGKPGVIEVAYERRP